MVRRSLSRNVWSSPPTWRPGSGQVRERERWREGGERGRRGGRGEERERREGRRERRVGREGTKYRKNKEKIFALLRQREEERDSY